MSTIAMSGPLEQHGVHERVAVADRGDDVEAVVAQQAREPVAQEREILGDHDPHGITARTVVAAARRARDLERAVERLDAPREPDEPGSRRVGAPDAVVGDLHEHRGPAPADGDVDVLGVRVLAGVGERLGDDEVGRALDGRRRAGDRRRR